MDTSLTTTHILFLTHRQVDLPASVKQHLGQCTVFTGKRHFLWRLFGSLHLNWRIRNLHATHPINAIVVDHPQFISDSLRSFTKKFAIPVIANNSNATFSNNIITRTKVDGFLQSTGIITGHQSITPIGDRVAVVPLALTQPEYWKVAGYKSNIMSLTVIGLHPDAAEMTKLSTALDIVQSLNPDMSIDIITAADQNPTPLIKRLKKSHLIITVAKDPVWIETTAVVVAAGIPIISPKRPLHHYLPPKSFPGYVVSDWQIDTLTTIIQNSIAHPEETYRIAKNAQSWLKANLGQTFLPLSWLSGLRQLVLPDSETKPSSATAPHPVKRVVRTPTAE